MSTKQVSLLLSGGIDSTAALSYYLENGYQVLSYFVHYGHIANDVELLHAQAVCKYYDINLNLLRFSGVTYNGNWEITGRNAFLILSTLMANQSRAGIISAGIIKGSIYYDCNDNFIQTMKTLINDYTDGRVRLDLPFIEMSKSEVIAYCVMHNVPIEKTFSCQAGGDAPCEKCPSCIERDMAMKSAKNICGGV